MLIKNILLNANLKRFNSQILPPRYETKSVTEKHQLNRYIVTLTTEEKINMDNDEHQGEFEDD